jgi:hypothetical protein
MLGVLSSNVIEGKSDAPHDAENDGDKVRSVLGVQFASVFFGTLGVMSAI